MITKKTNIVVLVSGLPGSGKSYFAQRLAETIHADYVNSDRLRKELFPKRTYSDLEKARVYDTMLKKMKEAFTEEKNLVMDATFHKKEIRELFTKNSKEKIYFIEVHADEGIIKERLQKNRPFSEADFEVFQLIREAWEPLNRPHLTLQSTNENIDDMLQKATQYLRYDKGRNR